MIDHAWPSSACRSMRHAWHAMRQRMQREDEPPVRGIHRRDRQVGCPDAAAAVHRVRAAACSRSCRQRQQRRGALLQLHINRVPKWLVFRAFRIVVGAAAAPRGGIRIAGAHHLASRRRCQAPDTTSGRRTRGRPPSSRRAACCVPGSCALPPSWWSGPVRRARSSMPKVRGLGLHQPVAHQGPAPPESAAMWTPSQSHPAAHRGCRSGRAGTHCAS